MTDRRGFLAGILALMFGWKVRRRPSATLAPKRAEKPMSKADVDRLSARYYHLMMTRPYYR